MRILITESQYDDLLKRFGNMENDNDTLEKFINDDGFTEETLNDKSNRVLLIELDKIKQELIKFNNTPINELPITNIKQILFATQNYQLQIERLRQCIQPQFSMGITKHPVSNIEYIQFRGYWFTAFKEKKRILSGNIGRVDHYGSIKNPQIKEDGLKLMKKVTKEKYESYYTIRTVS